MLKCGFSVVYLYVTSPNVLLLVFFGLSVSLLTEAHKLQFISDSIFSLNKSPTMQLSALHRIGQVERAGRVAQENRPFTQITRRLEGLHSRRLFHYDALEPVYMVRLCEKCTRSLAMGWERTSMSFIMANC